MQDKKYTFRLLKEDKELIEYLDQIPLRKRSLVIRNMLRSAFEHAMAIHRQNIALEQIQKQLTEMKNLQETCLKELKNIRIISVDAEEKPEERNEGAIQIQETAKAFLNVFGGE